MGYTIIQNDKTCRSTLRVEMLIVYPTSAGLFFRDDIMKRIPLTQGKFALVDNEDFEWLSQWKWQAQKGRYTYYAARRIPIQSGEQRAVWIHRQILGLKFGDGIESDHRNNNGLDNRKANLRPCTPRQNQWNRLPRKNVSSKYKGVGWHKDTQKWQAHITYNSEFIWLGLFSNETEAAKAYDVKAKKLFGEFARTNF